MSWFFCLKAIISLLAISHTGTMRYAFITNQTTEKQGEKYCLPINGAPYTDAAENTSVWLYTVLTGTKLPYRESNVKQFLINFIGERCVGDYYERTHTAVLSMAHSR